MSLMEAPLEDVGEVAQVEDVVELDGGRHEDLRQFRVEVQGRVHHVGARLPHEEGELVARRVQVVGQDGIVDGVQGVLWGINNTT